MSAFKTSALRERDGRLDWEALVHYFNMVTGAFPKLLCQPASMICFC